MNLEQARYRLLKLTQKQKMIFVIDALLWSAASGTMIFSSSSFLTNSLIGKMILALTGALLAFIIRGYRLGLFAFTEKSLLRLVNQHYKKYEESADLLFDSGNNLTSLQQLQQARTLSEFSRGFEQLTFPNQLVQAFIVFVGGMLIAFALSFLAPTIKTDSAQINDTVSPPIQPKLPPSIKAITLQVTPPAYTGIKSYNTEKLNFSIPEGSVLKWSVTFSDVVKDPLIRFTGSDSLPLKSTGDKSFSSQQQCTESFIYQITWQDGANQVSSDYYKIDVILDMPPSISVVNLAQFSKLTMQDQPVINLKSNLADDYGLQQAHIVATVSKGSGESIKFREEKLYFSKPEKFSGKSAQASRTIDLKKLGMEPGDELYFYVEAFDNKTPSPNRSRTETYFVTLQDTTSNEVSMDGGLGVDLMPEYFRNQRQIIIDTEKLLRDKKKITAKQFKTTSNELGYDQKVLRLKYGEFLGEEFESGIGPQSPIGGEDGKAVEEIMKQYGHTHDTENEHNLVDDKKSTVKEKEQHHHEQGEEGKEESPLEAFAHHHDNAEEATFFVLSVKAKLKAALTVMWDAELYLRLYEPQKSLPFQYQALKLLKEISNDSRIYVHRTGFDPPPIKEESRLKGDLSEATSTLDKYSRNRKEDYPAIRKSLLVVETMLNNEETTISPSTKTLFRQAGNELSAVALEKPGMYLTSLSLLQALIQSKIPEEKMKSSLLELRKTFWKVADTQPVSPDMKENMLHEIDRQFIENLTYD